MDTLGKTIDRVSEVKKALKELFNTFHTLENILQYPESARRYQLLALCVIAEREKELGNVEYGFMSYKITTVIEQVKEKYKGTVLGPLL